MSLESSLLPKPRGGELFVHTGVYDQEGIGRLGGCIERHMIYARKKLADPPLSNCPPSLLEKRVRFKANKLLNPSLRERQAIPVIVWRYIDLAH